MEERINCLYYNKECTFLDYHPIDGTVHACDRCIFYKRYILKQTIEKPKEESVGPAKTEADSVNHPSHYNVGNIEVIDFIEDKKLNFNRGNAIKYISRAGHKDSSKEIEDLEKAKWYIEREINLLKK